MNVLIFVLSFLMIIASISYQALGHYKSNAEIRGIWERYLHIDEPCAYNRIVDELYRKLKQSQGKPAQEKEAVEKKEEDVNKAASAINFRFLVDTNYQVEYPIQTEQMETLIKHLILFLYSDQIFFQTLNEKRPNFLDEMIPALRASNEEGNKITSKRKLQQLTLKDPELNEFWYQLRKSNPISSRVIQQLFTDENKSMQETPCFEVSLLDYLSNSNVQQLRVYLASRPLLMVLLENGEQVNEILSKRKELHSEVLRKTMTQEEATQEFQSFSQKFSGFSHYEGILNYKVTTTNPADYE